MPRRQVAEINVVPYIDVMLVLLVIFMITTPLLTQGVDIDLPKAQANAVDSSNQEPLIVTVNKKGQLFLNSATNPKKAMSQEALATRLAAELAVSKRPVYVRGDKQVDYGRVVRAMALIQTAGAERVGLLTESPSQKYRLSDRLKPRG